MKYAIYVLVLLLVICMSDSLAQGDRTGELARLHSYAKYNSDNWFMFGPGLLRAAKYIVFIDENNKEYDVGENDANFPAVMQWLIDNFAEKINFSEKKEYPVLARLKRKILILKTQRPAKTDHRSGPADSPQQTWIVTIPISSTTLCVDEVQVEKKYRELKSLILHSP